jgi:hypothetical protein
LRKGGRSGAGTYRFAMERMRIVTAILREEIKSCKCTPRYRCN